MGSSGWQIHHHPLAMDINEHLRRGTCRTRFTGDSTLLCRCLRSLVRFSTRGSTLTFCTEPHKRPVLGACFETLVTMVSRPASDSPSETWGLYSLLNRLLGGSSKNRLAQATEAHEMSRGVGGSSKQNEWEGRRSIGRARSFLL
jgi:hypothetical protein